jgi:hypothetical protein
MAQTESFARALMSTQHRAIAVELQNRLDRDQHDLFHDGEFALGCKVCDADRLKYS